MFSLSCWCLKESPLTKRSKKTRLADPYWVPGAPSLPCLMLQSSSYQSRGEDKREGEGGGMGEWMIYVTWCRKPGRGIQGRAIPQPGCLKRWEGFYFSVHLCFHPAQGRVFCNLKAHTTSLCARTNTKWRDCLIIPGTLIRVTQH